MPKRTKTTKKRGKRRSGAQVQELLGKVAEMRNAGEPLMKALAKLGISYSNYNYWTKKRGGGSGRGKRATTVGARGGVFSILDEMRANRSERQQLEKSIRALDAKFNQLKAKLGRSK